MFGRLYVNINRNMKGFFYIYLFVILRKGMRQNHRISVRDIILLPRQSPRRPPMLLMRLILSKKFQRFVLLLPHREATKKIVKLRKIT